MSRIGALVAACLAAAACGGETPDAPPPRPVPDETLLIPPEARRPPPLTEAAQATVSELREIAAAGRLRALARRADAEEGFLSNFAGERHITHWDLLRRTGVDPNQKLIDLFEQPHGAKDVGAEVWFIWPDLAAFEPDDLLPEKLSFKDRARLRDLIGEEGIAQVRAGGGYPGFRTAVSEDGRWLYFVHEAAE